MKKTTGIASMDGIPVSGPHALISEKPVSAGLIKAFLYFAVFKHPLSKQEAYDFCQYKAKNIDDELQYLVNKKLLYEVDGYYLPYDQPEWVARRIKGNLLAQKKMRKARKMAKVLSYFPYVRSAMVSGSLSKGYMDRDSDIDFFVIMHPGSMAISKFFMGLFRRFFARKSFCINFLIDSDHLLIEKQNLYTAIEMVTLIPLVDDKLYHHFMEKNMYWIERYLPNTSLKNRDILPYKQSKLQIALERLCSSRMGRKIDQQLRHQYVKRLKKNASKETQHTGEIVINNGVIKLHGKPYQKKILGLYKKYQENFILDEELVYKQSIYD